MKMHFLRFCKRQLTLLLAAVLLLSACQGFVSAAESGLIGDPTRDGQVNATDALFVLRAAVGKQQADDYQTIVGDVNEDEKLDAKDALMILQYAVGKRDSFPRVWVEEGDYYGARDREYRVDYSDFTEPVTINDVTDAAEIVQKLGGDPQTGPVDTYGVTQDNKLAYTPLSNEAKRLGKLAKYDRAAATTGTIKLGGTTLTYSVPKNATAYDAVPVTYSVYSTDSTRPIHLEATAFEDPARYQHAGTDYYDCNLPGQVSVKMEYEGYVRGEATGGAPRLSPDPAEDLQGSSYPSFRTSDLQKTGTLQSGGYCTWFKFKFTNTGNTILDGEGNSTFRFAATLYRRDGSSYINMGGTPNVYYPLLDYVYPGESGEMWCMFNAAGGSPNQFALKPGDYRIVINGFMRNEKDGFNFAAMQVAGKSVTSSTFDFTVTETGAQTTPNAVVNKSTYDYSRNLWLGEFEEFMSSYTTMQKNIGETPDEARKGVLYVQPAPWTSQIVLKLIMGNEEKIRTVRIPLQVETDSIQLNLNTENENWVVTEDGTRTPMVYTQNMADMRGNIDRGPYCNVTILNELRNMKEAGVNTITTTHAAIGDFSGMYDMTMYMLDCARDMGFTYEGHCKYYYRDAEALNRVRASDKTVDLGTERDLFNTRQLDAANGILARWNLIRYGDFYFYNPVTKKIPIAIEENYGWMTHNLNNRYGIDNTYADRLLYNWLKSAYNNNIAALNAKYHSSYGAFNNISISSEPNYGITGNVYKDWNAATMELDLFRTTERVRNYKEMLNKLNVNGAQVYLRSENAVFLAPGISQTTRNVHYRQMYYEQRRAALVPEVLAASGIIYGDSSYCYIPFTPSEVYELTRQAAKAGFNTAKTPSFNHMTDVVMNDYAGNYDYVEKLSLGENGMAKGCAIGVVSSLFTWCKAIYEAGGVPGLMWQDYNCDLYCTTTQYKELQFFNQKVQEMLSTEEGREWATQIPAEQTASPIADLAKGAYSYDPAYIADQIANVKRENIIMDFCH